jgi:hypothetical protein
MITEVSAIRDKMILYVRDPPLDEMRIANNHFFVSSDNGNDKQHFHPELTYPSFINGNRMRDS